MFDPRFILWGMFLFALARLNPAWSDEASASIEERIEAQMRQQVDVRLDEQPLTVLTEIGRRIGIPVVIDRRSLEDVGIAIDTPVSANLAGVTIEAGLNHILRQLELTWMILDGAVVITTPEVEERFLKTRLYDVRDLVNYYVDDWGVSADTEQLIEIITSTVAPNSWEAVGGPGSIDAFEAGEKVALVVSQTRSMHREIADLLSKLRRLEGALPQRPESATRPAARTIRRRMIAAGAYVAPVEHE